MNPPGQPVCSNALMTGEAEAALEDQGGVYAMVVLERRRQDHQHRQSRSPP